MKKLKVKIIKKGYQIETNLIEHGMVWQTNENTFGLVYVAIIIIITTKVVWQMCARSRPQRTSMIVERQKNEKSGKRVSDRVTE